MVNNGLSDTDAAVEREALIAKYEELLVENEKLREENKRLRAELTHGVCNLELRLRCPDEFCPRCGVRADRHPNYHPDHPSTPVDVSKL